MKVWKVSHEGVINLEDLGPSQVRKDCVKIKMLSTALTSTEKLAYQDKLEGCDLPIVIGRNGAGMVSEVDASVTNFKRGDRVYVSSEVPCGECYFCKSGRSHLCSYTQTYGKDVDGLMSDFAIVNTDSLYLLPDRVGVEEAVFIEKIALAINTINTLNVDRGDHLVILGASVFGLILAQVALYYQAVPILVDNRPERLALAEQRDIYYSINSSKEDVYKRVLAITGGKMASRVAFDLEGKSVQFDSVLSLVAKGGKVAFAGIDAETNKVELDVKQAIDKNASIFGINKTNENISSAINMLANKQVDVTTLMQIIDFEEVKEYVEKLTHSNDFLQIVVKLK